MKRSRSSTIRDDIACLGCGYLLKGLANRGRCPECAAPVRRSTRASRAFDQPWRRFDRAALWCIVVIALAAVGIGLAGWIGDRSKLLSMSQDLSSAAIVIMGCAWALSYRVRHSWIAHSAAALAALWWILIAYL